LAGQACGRHACRPSHRLTIAAIGWLQVIGGWLRGTKGSPTTPGDHYDMTRRRLLFEATHKHLGWLALPLVILATSIGLFLADAPRWMALILGFWWLLLIAAFAMLQRSGLCIDTYQAIWGPDPVHPGNQRKPIGWGVVRHEPDRLCQRSLPAANRGLREHRGSRLSVRRWRL
jgi:hypothetical protein